MKGEIIFLVEDTEKGGDIQQKGDFRNFGLEGGILATPSAIKKFFRDTFHPHTNHFFQNFELAQFSLIQYFYIKGPTFSLHEIYSPGHILEIQGSV